MPYEAGPLGHYGLRRVAAHDLCPEKPMELHPRTKPHKAFPWTTTSKRRPGSGTNGPKNVRSRQVLGRPSRLDPPRGQSRTAVRNKRRAATPTTRLSLADEAEGRAAKRPATLRRDRRPRSATARQLQGRAKRAGGRFQALRLGLGGRWALSGWHPGSRVRSDPNQDLRRDAGQRAVSGIDRLVSTLYLSKQNRRPELTSPLVGVVKLGRGGEAVRPRG